MHLFRFIKCFRLEPHNLLQTLADITSFNLSQFKANKNEHNIVNNKYK